MNNLDQQLNIGQENINIKNLKFGDVEKYAIPYIEEYMKKNGSVDGWKTILSRYEEEKLKLGKYNHNLVPDELKEMVTNIHTIAVDIYHGRVKSELFDNKSVVEVIDIVDNKDKKELNFEEMNKYYLSNPEMNFATDEHAKEYKNLLYKSSFHILNHNVDKKEIWRKIAQIKNYSDYQNLDWEIETLKEAGKKERKENVFDILNGRELALQLTSPWQGKKGLEFSFRKVIMPVVIATSILGNLVAPTIANANGELKSSQQYIYNILSIDGKMLKYSLNSNISKKTSNGQKINIKKLFDNIDPSSLKDDTLNKPKEEVLKLKIEKGESIISTLQKLNINKLVEIQGRIGATNKPNGDTYKKEVLATLIANYFKLPKKVKEGDYLQIKINKDKVSVKLIKANSKNEKIKGLEYFGDEIKIDIQDGHSEDGQRLSSNWLNLIKNDLNKHFKETKEKISDVDAMHILSQLGIVKYENGNWKVKDGWELRAGEQSVNLETYQENGKRYLYVSLKNLKGEEIQSASIEIEKETVGDKKIEKGKTVLGLILEKIKNNELIDEKKLKEKLSKYKDKEGVSLSKFLDDKDISKVESVIKNNKVVKIILYKEKGGKIYSKEFIRKDIKLNNKSEKKINNGDTVWEILAGEGLNEIEIAKIVNKSGVDKVVIKPGDKLSFIRDMNGKILRVNIYRNGRQVKNQVEKIKVKNYIEEQTKKGKTNKVAAIEKENSFDNYEKIKQNKQIERIKKEKKIVKDNYDELLNHGKNWKKVVEIFKKWNSKNYETLNAETQTVAALTAKIISEAYKRTEKSGKKIEDEIKILLKSIKGKQHEIAKSNLYFVLSDLSKFPKIILNEVPKLPIKAITALFKGNPKNIPGLGKITKIGYKYDEEDDVVVVNNFGVEDRGHEYKPDYELITNIINNNNEINLDNLDLNSLPYDSYLVENGNQKILLLQINQNLHIGIIETDDGGYKYIFKDGDKWVDLQRTHNLTVSSRVKAIYKYIENFNSSVKLKYLLAGTLSMKNRNITDKTLSSVYIELLDQVATILAIKK